MAAHNKRKRTDDEISSLGGYRVASGRFGGLGTAGFADRQASRIDVIRRDPGRQKNYNKHYNKHYNYHHNYNKKYYKGRYHYGGRYWGHRYYARPYNWQALGCIVVGPVWYCP